ncbi:T6SS effector BTH_I2691 family protein [Pantoea sp. GD03673]|uniref:T6SS effector BTH_I2691 family protein n=1 Tax=Pantoea sp. GD03673 TaxID=2975364 RepID=UPI002449EFEA|nr:T6SS effector BTH_I2691 family protein [Pantoea sp. GD03673]MDH2067437.1 hypothetical protein [Pantoea sp. GD03673]
MSASLCTRCASIGPALLPARYAVVTDNIRSGIPGWATPATQFPHAEGYDYAVRALRQGFVYVYYESNQQWDGWSVCEDGSLWKQPAAAYAQPKKTPDCHSPEHSATNMEMMVLSEEALQGNTWIAFSPSKWGLVTLDRYAQDKGMREKRMQCLASWQWSAPANADGVTAASPGSIGNILDYQQPGPANPMFLLPCNLPVKRISQTEVSAPWYTFEERDVKPQGTLYAWSKLRAGNVSRTLKALQSRGQGKNRYGKEITPLVMALHDPIGIAHELTGFSDDYAALHRSWMNDLSIEFASDSWLNGAENQIHALKNARAKIQSNDRLDYNQQMMEKYNRYGHKVDDAVVAEWRKRESERAFKESEDEYASEWKKYTKKLNLQKRQAFHNCNNRFFEVLAQKLETLAELRIKWMNENSFVVCSQDFYSTQVEDNLSYREAVDYALASLNLTQAGTKFLDKLIEQYSANNERNFVWRSIMLNNPEVIAETQSFLQAMEQHKDNYKKADQLTYIITSGKLEGKFVKAYGKANDIIANNPTPTSAWSRVMLATDRRMTTLGDRFFNFTRLGKSLDTMNELLSKVLFTVSAGVATVSEEVERGVAQLVSADAFRKQLLDNLKIGERDSEKISKTNKYKINFDDFAKSADGKKSIKKSSIQLLLFAFNMLEYSYIASKADKEPENSLLRLTVYSSLFSTIKVATDVIEPAVESGIKNPYFTKNIKWIGHAAANSASSLMLGIDVFSGINEFNGKSRWQFILLFTGKVLVDAGTLLKALEGIMKFAVDREIMSARNILLTGTSHLLTNQIIAFLASWQAMLLIFIIEQLVIYFSDNDLQDWCEVCVFGEDPEAELISTDKIKLLDVKTELLRKQESAFNKAVKVIE